MELLLRTLARFTRHPPLLLSMATLAGDLYDRNGCASAREDYYIASRPRAVPFGLVEFEADEDRLFFLTRVTSHREAGSLTNRALMISFYGRAPRVEQDDALMRLAGCPVRAK